MNDVFVTYRHLRRDTDTSTQGGVTLAILVDMRDPSDRVLKFAYALCNPEFDNFNKAEGRRVAYRRLADYRKGKPGFNRFTGFYEDTGYTIPYGAKSEGTIVEQILSYVQDHSEDFKELTKYLNRYVY